MECSLISEISELSGEPLLLRGKVSQVSTRLKIAEGVKFMCERCGHSQAIEISLTDDSIPKPRYCPMDVGCGSGPQDTNFIQMELTGEFHEVVRVRLHHNRTWFNLTILIGELEPPKKGDWIEFECEPKPIVRDSPVITSWRGLSTGFEFIGATPK